MSDPAGLEEYESMHSDMLSDEGGDAESSGSGSEKAPERVQPSFAQYVDEEDLDDDEDDEEEISEDEASDASGSDEDDGDLVRI